MQAVMLKELGDRKYGMSLARDDLQNYVDADEVAVPVVSEVIGHMKIQSDQTQNNPYHLQTKWLLYTCMHAYIYIYIYILYNTCDKKYLILCISYVFMKYIFYIYSFKNISMVEHIHGRTTNPVDPFFDA